MSAEGSRDRVVHGLLAATEVAVDGESPTRERLQRLCEIARETVPCDRSSIFLCEEDGRYHAFVNAGNPPDVAAAFTGYSMAPENPFLQQLERSGSMIVENDPRSRPGLRTLAAAARIHSLAMAPIADGGRMVGFFTVEHNVDPADIDPTAAAIAQTLANVAWQIHSSTELRARARRLLAAELAAGQKVQRLVADRLHDGPLQVLISLSLRLELAASDAPGPVLRDELVTLARHASDEGARLRDLILDLDSLVGHRDLGSAVRTLAQSYETAGGWQSTVRLGPGLEDVPQEVAFVVERLVQAALSDARDRAQPRQLTIDLQYADGDAIVEIDYDGRTAEPLGRRDAEFVIVAERVEALAGRFEVTDHDTGTRIVARIPSAGSTVP